ncbi:CAP domain-containing protein [Saccharibacillus sp. CPCC 101409]|uniref:CAP domain-containing protein n=1 Tax=Saccharibacillus sp. CPCC 101409 TaxID=3058041 RepID=UPI002673F3B4|nr:CAP domain-containing protein [Saccharibacillus sp. CPCC 101409]MDO3410137.1 CAP domain-containing protein [Saccharibacillus sp. CPCC 101409]
MTRKFGIWLLVLTLLAVCLPAGQPAQAAQAFNQDQLQALDKLNKIRAAAGAPPVVLSETLSAAAKNHASYYNLNEAEAKEDPHSETFGRPGFTGQSIRERFVAAGWSPTYRGAVHFGETGGEVMAFKEPGSSHAIDSWLDTAYHRAGILDTSYSEVGIALVDGTAVFDLGGSGEANAARDTLLVYPYDGMQNTGIGFYGFEVPNPLDWFGAQYSGYIVSAQAEEDFAEYSFTLKNEQGESVDYYADEHGDRLFFMAKELLRPNRTYRAELSYTIEGDSSRRTRSWSFRTGEGLPLRRLSPRLPQVMVNEGDSAALVVNAEYRQTNAPVEEVSSLVAWSPASNAGYRIKNGRVYGSKAGTYTVKAAYNGKDVSVRIVVLPKLKTTQKAVPSGDAAAWARLSGAPARQSAGAVTEAEFLTLLLQAYRVDIAKYAPKKAAHWADGAYAAAAARNLPVGGIQSAAARNKAITRGKAAELIAAASGVSYSGDSAYQYVMGLDYMRGEISSYLDGFAPERTLSFAEAAALLGALPAKNGSLLARPAKVSPDASLPALPEEEYYVVPGNLEKPYLIARYEANGTLNVTGMFEKLAGRALEIKIDAAFPDWKAIGDYPVQVDSAGNFSLNVPGLSAKKLNLYLRTEETDYFVRVSKGTFNIGEFGWMDDEDRIYEGEE